MAFKDYIQQQYTLERINSAYYIALGSAARVANRPGAAAFFDQSAKDERHHAKRIEAYMVARLVDPIVESVPAIPVIDGSDYLGMFKMALKRENITTQSLADKTTQAFKDNDWQTVSFFVSSQDDWVGYQQEQTESELELNDDIIEIGRCGQSEAALAEFDQQLLKKYSND